MTLQDTSSLSAVIEQYTNNEENLPEFSEKSAEALYAFSYGFYAHGKYKKAVQFFRFLTMLDPKKKKYWMGLGASYQMLKDEERALPCYGVATLLDQNDPRTHFHAAECFFSLGKRELGYKALHSAEAVADSGSKQDKALLSRIALMKEHKDNH